MYVKRDENGAIVATAFARPATADGWQEEALTEEQARNEVIAPNIEAARAHMIQRAKSECAIAITRRWPIFKQLNAVAGIYGPDASAQATAHIIACRDVCEQHEAAIGALSERGEILAYDITAGWPA